MQSFYNSCPPLNTPRFLFHGKKDHLFAPMMAEIACEICPTPFPRWLVSWALPLHTLPQWPVITGKALYFSANNRMPRRKSTQKFYHHLLRRSALSSLFPEMFF